MRSGEACLRTAAGFPIQVTRSLYSVFGTSPLQWVKPSFPLSRKASRMESEIVDLAENLQERIVNLRDSL